MLFRSGYLKNAVNVADDLFRSAHADYLEVLTVQREALERQLDQVETRLELYTTVINLYRSLGGGWR